MTSNKNRNMLFNIQDLANHPTTNRTFYCEHSITQSTYKPPHSLPKISLNQKRNQEKRIKPNKQDIKKSSKHQYDSSIMHNILIKIHFHQKQNKHQLKIKYNKPSLDSIGQFYSKQYQKYKYKQTSYKQIQLKQVVKKFERNIVSSTSQEADKETSFLQEQVSSNKFFSLQKQKLKTTLFFNFIPNLRRKRVTNKSIKCKQSDKIRHSIY
eukprot:TRINITY_DN2976_c0_g1_i1.p2 TRINITY_DN2976_c0_g1~~TRINITY_DN2976_c0_g1_i1.p2  ORF type:complete len:243 (+),score=-4.10 TRINITY_DN2976_c0_g1_i1:101-730(+)